MSAAASEHPPAARSSHAPLPARAPAGEGEGGALLCLKISLRGAEGPAGAAQPPAGKDPAQSRAPCPVLLACGRGDAVVALGGIRNASCVP